MKVRIAVSAADVKAEAERRLAATDWMIIRAADPTGKPVPADVLAARKKIRVACDALLAMNPVPHDYLDDKHWL